MLSVLLTAQSAARRPDADLEITLTPVSAVYKLGKPIELNMVLFNPTDHEIGYGFIKADDQGYIYYVSVTRIDTGKEPERTNAGNELYYEKFRGAPPAHGDPFLIGGALWLPLASHQSKTIKTDLTHTFKFTEPGDYRVEILRRPSEPEVEPITIVVEP